MASWKLGLESHQINCRVWKLYYKSKRPHCLATHQTWQALVGLQARQTMCQLWAGCMNLQLTAIHKPLLPDFLWCLILWQHCFRSWQAFLCRYPVCLELVECWQNSVPSTAFSVFCPLYMSTWVIFWNSGMKIYSLYFFQVHLGLMNLSNKK